MGFDDTYFDDGKPNPNAVITVNRDYYFGLATEIEQLKKQVVKLKEELRLAQFTIEDLESDLRYRDIKGNSWECN